MGDAIVVLAVLLALVAVLLSLDYRDGNRFACLFAEDRDMRAAGLHGYFQYSEDTRTFVNRGEREVCLEDIVDFVNRRRMGPDMKVNTVDDAMTLEQQVDMLGAMLEANFHGGFWVSTPWMYQYNGGSPVLSRLLYADPDEVVVVSGSRTTYSGMLDTAATAESIFLLEGGLRLQRRAPLRGVLLAPLLRRRATDTRLEAVAAEGELWQNAFRIKKGKQLLYGTAGQPAGEGAFFLHYYSGSMLSIAVWKFIWPCVKEGDLRSAWTFASAFAESFYRNGVLPVVSIFFKKEDSWWTSQTNFSRREATAAAFGEEVFAEEVETGEEDALPAFRRQVELLKQQRRAFLSQRSSKPQQQSSSGRGEDASASDGKRQQQQEQEQRREKPAYKLREEREQDAENDAENDVETGNVQDAANEGSSEKRRSDERNTHTRADEWRRTRGQEEEEEDEGGREEDGSRGGGGDAGEDGGGAAAKGASSASEREERTWEKEERDSTRKRDTEEDDEGGGESAEIPAKERTRGEERKRGEEEKFAAGEKREGPSTQAAEWEGGEMAEEEGEAATEAHARAEKMGPYSAAVFKEALELLRERLEKQKQEWAAHFPAADLFSHEAEDEEYVGHEEL